MLNAANQIVTELVDYINCSRDTITNEKVETLLKRKLYRMATNEFDLVGIVSMMNQIAGINDDPSNCHFRYLCKLGSSNTVDIDVTVPLVYKDYPMEDVNPSFLYTTLVFLYENADLFINIYNKYADQHVTTIQDLESYLRTIAESEDTNWEFVCNVLSEMDSCKTKQEFIDCLYDNDIY